MSCLYSVVVNPSSNKTPNDISGAAFIFEKMWICLACLLIPGIWSVAMCDDSIVLPYIIFAVISFAIIAGDIAAVDSYAWCLLAAESTIASMLLLG